jgi:hypothetical protein
VGGAKEGKLPNAIAAAKVGKRRIVDPPVTEF